MPIVPIPRDLVLPNPRGLLSSSIVPEKGATLVEEIRCYGLPYGGLGFASHILTYYTLACLWHYRKPLWPLRRLIYIIHRALAGYLCNRCPEIPAKELEYTGFNYATGAISLIFTVALSIFTMVKCANSWQLVAIASSKLLLSFVSGVTALHAAGSVASFSDYRLLKDWQEHVPTEMRWLVLTWLGMFPAMTGLGSIVHEHISSDHALKMLTIYYFSMMPVALAIYWRFSLQKASTNTPLGRAQNRTHIGFALGGAIPVMCLWYGDWALGIMIQNVSGIRQGELAYLSYIYVAAKRLPMFFW
ncbi:hypothetical protein GALMADRAFT_256737 [Galerina marginata CBS 339.88]|uniref:Uncharacterized protein n=1 Tax=Galerina marginata (strain CBS 339.88) TaxID=685588 RepID=A0A067SEV2_GALM3|nr:hypothetical protein GALMADRAFT_256737 [Galerina marginata CBS 339.88]